MCVSIFAHGEPNHLCLFQKRFSCTASSFTCQLCCSRRINPAVRSFSALAVDGPACSSGCTALSTLPENVQAAAKNKWESVWHQTKLTFQPILCLHLTSDPLHPLLRASFLSLTASVDLLAAPASFQPELHQTVSSSGHLLA